VRAPRPEGTNYLERLGHLLKQAQPGEEFTFEYLVHKIDPPSPEDLAAALALLVKDGVLRQTVRVESPVDHGGIGDYASIEEIPNELPDWRTGQDIAVRPEYLRVIYSPAWTNAPLPSLAAR
jgi:hypothetical protein